MIANRFLTGFNGLLVLLIDAEKVDSEIKYEAPSSGRGDTYPHIYGPLNVDAVYDIVPLIKVGSCQFIKPPVLLSQTDQQPI